MVDPVLLTSTSQVVQTLIKPLVDQFYTPKITELAKKFEEKKILNIEKFRKVIDDYVYSVYKNNEMINTLIFSNEQVKTKDIFFPINLQYRAPETKDTCQANVHDFMNTLLPQFTNVLISDTAGMGKSTLVKWLSLNQIENGLIIPIIIELKKIDRNHNLLDEIMKLINPLGQELNNDSILDLLQHGKFCIIFDGYDEIRSEHKESVTADIITLVSKVSDNQFILTSRPEESLASFGNFKRLQIKPLQLTESFEMFNIFDNISGSNISESLIHDVQLNHQVHEFLINPFLVSLLYKSYSYNKDIPLCKATFYSDVFSALYKGHDLTKGAFRREKKSTLGYEEFKIILRQLAFDSFQKNIVYYSYDELIEMVNLVKKKYLHISFSSEGFCDDLTKAVPLFIKEGHTYKWSHKSFLDYFAADFIITSEKQTEILEKIYDKKITRAMNVLGFVYELNTSIFRKIIISRFLADYINSFNSTLKEITTIPEIDLDIRKHLLTNHDVSLAVFTKEYMQNKYGDHNEKDFSRFAFDEFRLLKNYNSASCFTINDSYIVIAFQIKDSFTFMISQFIESKIQSFYQFIILKEHNILYSSFNYTNITPNRIYDFHDDLSGNPLNLLETFRDLNDILFYTINVSKCVYKIAEIKKIIQEIDDESRASEIIFE